MLEVHIADPQLHLILGRDLALVSATSFLGDLAVDADKDGTPALVEHAVGTSDASPNGLPFFIDPPSIIFRRNLAADDVRIVIETSTDLTTWSPASYLLEAQIHNGDGTVTESWSNQTSSSERWFARLRVELIE